MKVTELLYTAMIKSDIVILYRSIFSCKTRSYYICFLFYNPTINPNPIISLSDYQSSLFVEKQFLFFS